MRSITRMIEDFDDRFLILAFIILAVIIRIVVISSSPSFIVGSDTPSYVAFARELINNHFLIPQTNAIHYPGSVWVYPPVLPEILALFMYAFKLSGFSSFYFLTFLSIIIDSFTIIPIWKATKLLFSRRTAVMSSLIFSCYLPDLYALTWGGYPQILATAIFAWIIYYVVKIVKAENSNVKTYVVPGLLLGLLALTHDISTFVVGGSVTIYILLLLIYSVISRENTIKKRSFGSAIKLLPSLVISSIFVAYWYIPRIWWVFDAAFPPSYIQSLNVPLTHQGFFSMIQANFQTFYGPLDMSMFIFPVLVLAIFYSIKRRKELSGIGFLFTIMISSALLILIEFRDQVLVSRLSYFIFLPALIIVSSAFERLLFSNKKHQSNNASETIFSKRSRGIGISIVLSIILIAVSAEGIYANMVSHSYYAGNDPSANFNFVDSGSLQWIHSNTPQNAVFAAPGIYGFYLMGYDGNPTLDYESPHYLTQPVEFNESSAAYTLIMTPLNNVSLTEHYISLYHVSYVVTLSQNSTNAPSFYHEVFKDNVLTIYYV